MVYLSNTLWACLLALLSAPLASSRPLQRTGDTALYSQVQYSNFLTALPRAAQAEEPATTSSPRLPQEGQVHAAAAAAAQMARQASSCPSANQAATSTVPSTGEAAYKKSGLMDQFPKRLYADFSSATAGGDVAAALKTGGLYISTAEISGKNGNLARKYARSNVQLGNGQLEMSVSAYSGSGPVLGSSILTAQEFKYGSARVILKSTSVDGICIGHFFYENDLQEADIEILTSTATQASEKVEEGVWFSNQATSSNTTASKEVVPFGYDPSQGFHEYRIDWLPTYTAFFIDGVEKGRLTDNVPSVATSYVLNGWSDGDPTWSAGPPTSDGTFAIKSVEILYGYDS